MTKIPIEKKLKKKIHKKVAMTQDLLIIEMYKNFPGSVIHGGTSIWRCYNGNRFSEDIDVYLPTQLKEKMKFFKDRLEKIGFHTKKFKQTKNSIFSKFSYQGAIIRFEAVFKDIKDFITKSFEMSDGSFIIVNTLSPEKIIKEKISAYNERRKIRDLYDIFFLLNFVENKKSVNLKDLIFREPIDKKDLEVLIISGVAPGVDYMVRSIRKWAE